MTPAIRTLIAAMLIAAIPGCEVPMSERETAALPPEPARAQVVTAAREIAAALPSPVREAWFWPGPCGDGPEFRGQMRIAYDRAASSEVSDAQIAAVIARLRASGWTDATGFRSRSATLVKDGVHAVFRAQNASTATRGVEVLGGCGAPPGGTAPDSRPERIELGEPAG